MVFGLYEFCVVTSGLANAPSVLQALVNNVLRDMLENFIITYTDDILVYSPFIESQVLPLWGSELPITKIMLQAYDISMDDFGPIQNQCHQQMASPKNHEIISKDSH